MWRVSTAPERRRSVIGRCRGAAAANAAGAAAATAAADSGASRKVKVARVLDMTRDHWRGIVSIKVHRTEGIGVISYNEALRSSVFAGRKQRGQLWTPTRLKVDATLTRDLIIDIATDLKKGAEAEQRARAAALEGVAGSEQRIQPHRRRRRSVKQPRLKGGKKI